MHAGIANYRFPLKSEAEENVPGIPGACPTRNFTCLVRGLCRCSFYERGISITFKLRFWVTYCIHTTDDGHVFYIARNGGSGVAMANLSTPYTKTDDMCIELYFWGKNSYRLLVQSRGEDFQPKTIARVVSILHIGAWPVMEVSHFLCNVFIFPHCVHW